MPKQHYLEKLTPNLSIGVNVGPNVQGVGYLNKETGERTHHGAGVWTACFQFPSQTRKYRSTKVKYDGGASYAKAQAIKVAMEMLTTEADRVGRGLSVHELPYIHRNNAFIAKCTNSEGTPSFDLALVSPNFRQIRTNQM